MPEHYLLCYSTECPLADGCLHRLGAIHGQTVDKIVQAVNPQQCNGNDCPYYRPVKTARMAYGMTHLYDKVLARDIAALRGSINAHFGNGSYYLRRNGKVPITPAEQQWIARQFQARGYTDELQFDRYRDEIEW